MIHTVIFCTTNNTHTVVAAVANRKIRVLGYTLCTDDSVVLTWYSGSTEISGGMYLNSGGHLSVGYSSGMDVVPVLETGYGEALRLALNNNALVGGHLVYTIVG